MEAPSQKAWPAFLTTAVVTITDDDDPALLVSKSSVSLLEGQWSEEVLVVLKTRPTDDVVWKPYPDESVWTAAKILRCSEKRADCTPVEFQVTPAVLRFTPIDWNVTQSIVWTAVCPLTHPPPHTHPLTL